MCGLGWGGGDTVWTRNVVPTGKKGKCLKPFLHWAECQKWKPNEATKVNCNKAFSFSSLLPSGRMAVGAGHGDGWLLPKTSWWGVSRNMVLAVTLEPSRSLWMVGCYLSHFWEDKCPIRHTEQCLGNSKFIKVLGNGLKNGILSDVAMCPKWEGK